MRNSLLTRLSLALGLILIIAGLLLTGRVEAQPVTLAQPEPEPAELTVIVFEQGRPVDDLILRFGDAVGRTADGGYWRARLPAGEGRLTVFDNAQALTALPLELRPGEIVQVIITLSGPERRARVSVESSLGESAAGLAAEAGPAVEADAETGSGVLSGRVVSTENGEPVEDARVFVSGTPIDIRTDSDGRFRAELPTGRYSVSVLHPDFATRTVDGLEVPRDGEVRNEFQLPPAGLELAEFVVVEPFIEGSLSASFSERRETASIVEVLGSEQMSRAGDSDAASALERVTGLTLVDGQFIFIRGLGERYSSTLVNGASVPGPDPTRKVVPLDLFPAGVIESIRVQKGFSPSFPGDFGGGAIEIRIGGIPEKNYFKIGLSTSIREGTTFQRGRIGPRGGRDFTGFDDGTRELPDEVRVALDENNGSLRPANPITNPDGLTPEDLEAIGESFPAEFDQKMETIGPDRGVSINGGMRFDFGDWRAGFKTSVLWDDSYQTRNETRRQLTIGSGQLQVTQDFVLDRTEREVRLSTVGSFGAEYRDEHSINANSMVLRLTTDDTRFSEGFNENLRGNQLFQEFELKFEERQLIANQARGEHRFPALLDVGLNWEFSHATASRDEPDNRIVLFDNDRDSPTGFRFSQRADNNFRNFSDLTDETLEFGFDGSLPFDFGRVDGELTGGWQQFERDRDSMVLRFQFEGVENLPLDVLRSSSIEEIINQDTIGPNGLRISESTRATDNSLSSLDVDSWFANLDFTLFELLRLSGGVRFEDWTQEANTFRLFDPDRSPVTARLASRDFLPSVSATLFFAERQQLRASYAQTIVRPDLRELSPAPFTDPVLDREVIGNPDLVQSDLEHFDLRYDFLISPEELFSVGLFLKNIDNPIERGQQPGQERRISFSNVKEAELYGAELEWRKNVGFISRRLGGSMAWLEQFTMSGNVAYIESEISIDQAQAGTLTSTSRRLQGMSPFVVNAQLGYDSPGETFKATALYNVTGSRISEFGVLGQPDLFEQPAHQLDFNFAYEWSDQLTFKLKIKNLLDSAFEIKQGDTIVQRFTRGREFGLGIDLEF